MSVLARLGLFAVALVVVCAGAIGLGRVTGPVGPVGPANADDGRQVLQPGDGHGGEHGGGHGRGAAEEPAPPGGLTSSQDGLTLALERTTYRPGTREVAFRIDGTGGLPVTAYDVAHEREMHLVAVRRDGTGFQHVHPVLGTDGWWRVPLRLVPGSWRVLADFVPRGGEGLTLGADLHVPGRTDLPPRGPVTRSAVVDGYTVRLAGDLAAGEQTRLDLTVERDGVPVTDLQPYLGASGHLVALREGDLAYLHVHPVEDDDASGGPTVGFDVEVPSAGRYHLYLDFRHGGVVRTASFTLDTVFLVAATIAPGPSQTEQTEGADHEHD